MAIFRIAWQAGENRTPLLKLRHKDIIRAPKKGSESENGKI